VKLNQDLATQILTLIVVRNSSTSLNTLITIFFVFQYQVQGCMKNNTWCKKNEKHDNNREVQKGQMQDQMDKALVVTCQRMITRKILQDSISAIHSNRHPMKFNGCI